MKHIEEAIQLALEKASEHPYNPNVSYWDLERWGIDAYAEVICNLTDAYNSIYGEPTTIVDATESGIGGKFYFTTRVIIYKEKRILVTIDRLAQHIIPFDAIISCQPLDLSEQSISGGGYEQITTKSPTFGTIGNKIAILSTTKTDFVQRPIHVNTHVSLGVEISTNNMNNPTIDLWFGDNGNAVSKLVGIMKIILSDKNHTLSDEAEIETEEINLGDILSVSYPKEIEEIINRKKQNDETQAKKIAETQNNSGCMVVCLALVVSTICILML